MQAGKGMIKKENFDQLKEWCTFGGELDKSLLSSITGMQNGKGMIKKENFDQIKEWCTFGGKIDKSLLSSITVMLHGTRIVNFSKAKNYRECCEFPYHYFLVFAVFSQNERLDNKINLINNSVGDSILEFLKTLSDKAESRNNDSDKKLFEGVAKKIQTHLDGLQASEYEDQETVDDWMVNQRNQDEQNLDEQHLMDVDPEEELHQTPSSSSSGQTPSAHPQPKNSRSAEDAGMNPNPANPKIARTQETQETSWAKRVSDEGRDKGAGTSGITK